MNKTIEDAVRDLDGTPENADLYHFVGHSLLRHTGEKYLWSHFDSIATKNNPYSVICTRSEFEAVAREMGYPKGSWPEIGWHGECTWGRKVEWLECVALSNKTLAVNGHEGWHCRDCLPSDQYEFRPLRNERERWVEQASEVVNNPGSGLNNLYDALLSGELPMPKGEDK